MEERLVTTVKDELLASGTRADAKRDALTTTLNDVVTVVEKRFDAVDARFDSLEEHLTPMTSQVSGHENRLNFLEDRLPKLAH